jgi:phosphatidylserine/phosphatidylglycerophosphate/cardiolipin synthase-like enzyme
MKEKNMRFTAKCVTCLLILASLFCSNVQAAVRPLTAAAAACFTPDEDCTGLIVNAINGARSEILVQAFSFTSRPIARALINSRKRGVGVEIVLDSSFNELGKYAAVNDAADAGIPTFIDSFHKIAHNKIMIIDAQTVITGSFNFTRAAQYDNAENVIILKSTELAGIYRRHFLAHRKHSKPYAGRHEKKIIFKFPYRENGQLIRGAVN